MKKLKPYSKAVLTVLAAATLAACGNLSNVSSNGTTDNPVFPKIEKSGWNHDGDQKGSWVNWDNVRQIENGMNKDQIRHLIGDPQFGEGLYGVREWDYVFHYRENGEHKVCQYKVLFDKNMNLAQQWWLPNGCNGFSHYDLNADALFDFDKATLKPEGQAKIKAFAQDVKALNVTEIRVEGHTDRLGKDEYNMGLSQRRADAVANALVQEGVKTPIQSVGMGESQPVKECASDNGSAEEKACLAPNRRVTVLTKGGEVETQDKGAGHDGPVKVRTYQADANKTSWAK